MKQFMLKHITAILLTSLVLLILFPFIVNWCVAKEVPSWYNGAVSGEPKDWLLFWGSYIGGLFSALMAILTYAIIIQNNEVRRASIVFRIVVHHEAYCIEYQNIGNSTAYIKKLDFNKEFISIFDEKLKKMNGTYEDMCKRISSRSVYLNPQERKIIFLGNCRVIESNKELIEQKISITGLYETIGMKFNIKDEFCIDDFCFEYIRDESAVTLSVQGISKSIDDLKKGIQEKLKK